MKINYMLSLFFSFFFSVLAAQNGQDSVVYTLADTTLANLYHKEGNDLYGKGKYDETIDSYFKALTIRLKVLGNEHLRVAALYNNLGAVYAKKINYDKAIEYHEKSLVIRIKILSLEHPEVGISYNNLGTNYYYAGNYNKAIEYHEKALAVRLKILGTNHSDVANSYNHLGITYNKKGNDNQAIEYFEKSLAIRIKIFGVDHSDVVMSYNNLAVSYSDKGNYDKAIEYHEKAQIIGFKIFGANHSDVARSFNNIGTVYYSKGEYNKAIDSYNRALKINLKILGDEHADIADYYNNIGGTYYSKGEYNKAIEYNNKALSIRFKAYGLEHPDVAASYNNLGNIYVEQRDYDKAIEFLNKALSIKLKIYGHEHPAVAASYNNLGNTYRDEGDYNKAIIFYEKALIIQIKLLGSGHPDVAASYNNLGSTYFYKGNYDKSIEYYEKSLAIKIKAYGKEHPDVASAQINLGTVYRKNDNYGKTILYLQKALSSNRYNSYTVFDSVMTMKELITTLKELSITRIKQYTQTQDTTYLSQAYDLSNQALKAVAYQFKTLNTEGSKADLLKNSIRVSENALHINQLMSTVKDDKKLLIQSFTNAERAKSLILFGSLRENDALSYAGIPDSLLQKESDLRIDIAFYEKRRFEEESKGKEAKDSIINSYNSQLFDLKRSYETLKERFEKDYPDYYRLKYDLSTASLKYVQDTLLSKDQTLLEYFVGDSSIFIFTVNKENYKVLEVKKDFPLDSLVEAMRTGIYNTEYLKQPDSLMRFTTRYVGAAATLYGKLVAPVKNLLRGSVVIVPDGVLGYLPFDALLINKPNSLARPDKFNYLLNDHKISYCYSATILKDMVNKKHRKEPTQSFFAMAPYFKGDTATIKSDSTDYLLASINDSRPSGLRKGLDSLPYTGEEVTRLQRIMGGEAIVGKGATEDVFTKKASDARIIHLSTHGKMDDKVGDYSYLAFTEQADSIENEWLYTRELYNLSLNADMVVLSACETGIGKLQRGEGIISLARAFAYAGAKSIVTTLWQVKDESTKDIMVDFYKNLKRGKDKDEALQLAKLAYIKKHKNTLALPFFWSGIIPIGDMKVIGK